MMSDQSISNKELEAEANREIQSKLEQYLKVVMVKKDEANRKKMIMLSDGRVFTQPIGADFEIGYIVRVVTTKHGTTADEGVCFYVDTIERVKE